MSEGKKVNSLIKSSMIYIMATVIGQGMSFAGMVVFTRLMNQTDYGRYSTYYAYVAIFTVLIGANLYYVLNNAYIDKKDDIKAFRKSVLMLSTIIMLSVLIVALLIGTLILKKVSAFLVIMVALHSYGFFVVNYRIYSANMENDYKIKSWLLILPNTFQFLFSLALILLLPSISFEARVMGSALGVGIVGGVSYIVMLRYPGKVINLGYWKYALSIAIPTIIMSISYMLMQQCDKVMINRICGDEDTAVYSVIYYLGYAIIAIDQAAAPVRQAWMYKRLDEKKTKEIIFIQEWYLLLMLVMAAGVMLAGPEIVKIIAPENYWKYEYIIPFVLSACMMVLYRFFTEIILFYKKNITLSMCVMACSLINIGLNAVLIPKVGAVAACYTTVVAYSILFILTWIVSVKFCGKVYSGKWFVFYIAACVVLSVLQRCLLDYMWIRFSIIVLIIVSTCVYAYILRDSLRKILWNIGEH